MDKNRLRQIYRDQRKKIDISQFRQWNEQISKHLLEFFRQKYGTNAKPMMAAYCAKEREADVWQALKSLSESGYRFCFPRVIEGTERDMDFREASPSDAEKFTKGAFGILEPKKSCALVSAEDMDGILVPVLIFDESGARMGHGKGFYDQMLAGFARPKIGVAYEWQCSNESIPMEDHDVRLDYVVTENGVRRLTSE